MSFDLQIKIALILFHYVILVCSGIIVLDSIFLSKRISQLYLLPLLIFVSFGAKFLAIRVEKKDSSLHRGSSLRSGGHIIEADEFVTIDGGVYQRGDIWNDGFKNEKPVFQQEVKSFALAKNLVTNSQYARFLNEYKSKRVRSGVSKGKLMIRKHDWGVTKVANRWVAQTGYEDHPAIYVTWYGAREFCRFYGFRLPSEAEWEYAARSGNKNEKWSGTNTSSNLIEFAAFGEKKDGTAKIGSSKPNSFGIYDLSGNAWEWCSSRYHLYKAAYDDQSTNGKKKVIRGGAWNCDIRFVRSSLRLALNPGEKFLTGFRPAIHPNKLDFKIKDDNSHRKIDIVLVRIKGGDFEMGDVWRKGGENELPVHRVRLDNFYLSKYPVTNKQFVKFLNEYGYDRVKAGEYAGHSMILKRTWWNIKRISRIDKGQFEWRVQKGFEDHPVVCVSWYGAYEFSRHYGLRLPTEAEWEYAARGCGGIEPWAGTNDATQLSDYAWFNEPSKNPFVTTFEVGTKKPNQVGLHDMSGNVWEWCNDWYSRYEADDQVNPKGPAIGELRVIRGGSWISDSKGVLVSARDHVLPNVFQDFIGFRVGADHLVGLADPSQNIKLYMEWDIFISHASEDKDAIARPLAKALLKQGVRVWYDEFSLEVGDSLRRAIDNGLSRSRFGIVILSNKFFEKQWTQMELDGLAALEIDNRKVILPIWHEITLEQVRSYSPMFANRKALTSDIGVEKIVEAISKVLSKQ